MKLVDCGISGSAGSGTRVELHAISLPEPWNAITSALIPGGLLTRVQSEALGRHRLLQSRSNLIVASPTNSGKTAVGTLFLLEAIHRNRRAVLLEPLRALAREKFEEFESQLKRISKAMGKPLKVNITTGDYRLDDETFRAPPPDKGQLIIATLERFDAILRNPDYEPWVASIDAVCVDEAHLIASQRRGPTLECVITSLLCRNTPPRIALLSATLGNVEKVRDWLVPCQAVEVPDRSPPLQKFVVEVEAAEEANEVAQELIQSALEDPPAAVLVFVYQTKSAEKLARTLGPLLGSRAGTTGPLAYHAQLAIEQKERIRIAFLSGQCRCIIATTALGMGMNLPATHVIIRDTTFQGAGKLAVSEILQMMGRAGRGSRSGTAYAFVKPGEGWEVTALADALKQEEVPALISAFETAESGPSWKSPRESDPFAASAVVASCLARYPESGLPLGELEKFFARSLGGHSLVTQVKRAVSAISAPDQVLAHVNEERVKLTRLGLRAAQSVLPLELASGLGRLVRDILELDDTDQLLAQWQPLDHLILLELLATRPPSLRRFSQAAADQVDGWLEANPSMTPILYREWIVGEVDSSKSAELLGSLGIEQDGPESARKITYSAVLRAIVLHERGLGKTAADVQRQWEVKLAEGVEERWRDERLWLLAGISNLLDVPCFFFHLREVCQANPPRLERVQGLLRRMKRQALQLQDSIKYCSALGPVLRSLRRTRKSAKTSTIGIQTIRQLEDSGVQNLRELAAMTEDQIVGLGVRRAYAKQLKEYIRLRSQ